jgi:hypothetical protein
MLGLFRLLDEYVGPTTVNASTLCFVVLLSCTLKFSLEFVYLPFVERDVSIVIWILEFYRLN